MAEIKTINDIKLLLNDNRVFLSSTNINIFPCSRRGQYEITNPVEHYDPEARLNTERTNRLHTAINGFKDSFIERFDRTMTEVKDETTGETTIIERETGTLVFALAGYRIEAKNFSPADIAAALSIENGTIYAHLSLHNNVSLSAKEYYTEILYRQSDRIYDRNYLDVSYPDNKSLDDFFVGISFTTNEEVKDGNLPSYNLPLFTYNGSSWELIQTSLLPKIEHDVTEDSIKVCGHFTVSHDDLPELVVTDTTAEFAVPVTVTKPTGNTAVAVTISGGLSVVSGDTTLKKLSAEATDVDSLVVEGTTQIKDTLQVERSTGTGPAAKVIGSLEVTNSISTETINVNTLQSVDTIKTDKAEGLLIKSTANSPERTVKIEGKTAISGALDIATGYNVATDTLNVDSINSRVQNGTIIATSPVKLNHTLEVGGNARISSNLTVEDNINVGNPDEPASANNGGCIVAQHDITAEEDLVAKRDITSGGSATIAGNVTVGTDNNTSTGTIIAKNNITALGSIGTRNDLTVDRQAYVKTGLIVGNDTTSRLPAGEIKAMSKVTAPTLVVNEITSSESTEIVVAKVLKVDTINSDSTNGLTINQQLTAKKYINVGSPSTPTSTPGDIVAKNSIFAENDIVAKRTIKAPAIYQTVNGSDKPVPFIDLVEQDSGQYKLQISRVSKIEN